MRIKEVMLNYKAPIIVLVCFVLLLANSFAGGYFLNPVFEAPITFFIGLVILFFTLAPILGLAKKKNRIAPVIGQRLKVILTLILIWFALFTFGRFLSSGNAGVALRLGQFSEQEFEEIADLIDVAHKEHQNDPEDLFIDYPNYGEFLNDLKERHEIRTS